MDYQGLIDDRLPPIPKPLLQQYDNYQIYSMVWFAYTYDLAFQLDRERVKSTFSGDYNSQIVRDGIEYLRKITQEEMNFSSPLAYQYPETVNSLSVMYQRYSLKKIPFNFSDIANKIKVSPRNSYKWIQLDNVQTGASVTDEYIYSGDFFDVVQIDRSALIDQVADMNNPDDPSYDGRFHYLLKTITTYSTWFPNYTQSFKTQITYTIHSDTYSRYGEIIYDLNITTLITGYREEDKRKVLNYPMVVPTKTGKLSIGYYRMNPYETIKRREDNSLASLDWMSYDIDIVKDIPVVLPLEDPVLGTLCFSGDMNVITDIKNKLSALIRPPDSFPTYPWSDYYYENVDTLINRWISIYNTITLPSKPDINTTFLVGYEWKDNYTTTLKVLSANNDTWNNDDSSTSDINLTSTDVSLDLNRAYRLHIQPIIENFTIVDYGSLVMDSPRTIEIHKALNAGKWGINPDNPDEPRKDDLGWRIQRMNEVLGIRVGTDGKFDPAKEKTLVRKVIPANQKIDPLKVGVNCFSEDGLVLKRINNRFDKDEIKSDQCVIIHDVLQLIQEYHEQHNLAVGLQESSAIEIKDGKDKDGKSKARFDNQLGLLVEIFNLLSSANEMTRAALISSLVTQSQTSEVIAGLGLPSVTKTIPIEIDKKVTQLPYKGIAAHRSISQEVATCTANVGIVLGQLI